MSDIYASLGIPRDASEQAIRAAKRRFAAHAHPDKGGDKEAFAKMMAGVDMLLDPQRRLVYDKTGRMNWQPPQDGDVMNYILDAIGTAIDKFANPDGINWLNLVRQKLEGDDEKAVQQKNLLMARSIKFRKIAARITRKGGPNALRGMFEDVARKLEGLAEEMELNRKLHYRIREFLAQYEFSMAPIERRDFSNAGNPYLGAGLGFGGKSSNW